MRTRDLLRALTQPLRTPGVPDAVRADAGHLLRHYPASVDIAAAANTSPDVFGPVERGRPETPQEAGIAGGMYAYDDEAYVRAARRGRRGKY